MKIINHVLVDGKDLILESLLPEERERIERELVRRMAGAWGGAAEEEGMPRDNQKK